MIKWFFYRLFHAILLRLPRGSAYAIAAFLGKVAFSFPCYRRDVVIENFSIALKCEDKKKLHKIASKMYVNFAKYLVDFLCSERIDKKYIDSHVEFVDIENLDEIVRSGKGFIVLTAHLGNWELGGGAIALNGYPISAVALPHSNEKVNDFFNAQRSFMGMKVIPLGAAIRQCFALLKRGEILALVGDRDFTGQGEVMPFLNGRAFIPKGPASFSHRLNVPILPAFMLRKDDNSYSMKIASPIYPQDATGNMREEKDIRLDCVSVVEEYITKYPEQWFMFEKYFI